VCNPVASSLTRRASRFSFFTSPSIYHPSQLRSPSSTHLLMSSISRKIMK
jgi:hypothetical protein